MYTKYWNLTRKPFEYAAGNDFYYPSETHQGAMLKLRYAVESRTGGVAIVGASGLGKSLITGALLDQIPADYQPRIHVVFPQMPADQLIAYIATEIAESVTPPASLHESVARIRDFLAANAARGQHTVLAIDDAHLIDDRDTLQALRLLLNFETDGAPQMTLVLVGQPQLLINLDRCPSLGDRIAIRTLLRPLTLLETENYINHRCMAAGAKRTIFEPEAVDVIHELTHGVPRAINRLADLSLLIGFAEEKPSIAENDVLAVSEEMVAVVPE